MEIDLTYACNLRCNDCNRSVTQAPSSAHLTAADLISALAESAKGGHRWEMIRLLGGEPTLHPEFLVIIELLRNYRRRHAPLLRIEVITNGHGPRVNEVLRSVPSDVVVRNTRKTGNEQSEFEPFNRAPLDLPEHASSDFANGCWIAQYCGMGLTPSGYYHCAVAGGIDRVFGLGLGRTTIPDPKDGMRPEMAALCRYCGHFCKQQEDVPQDRRITQSWREAYAAWHAQRRSGRTRTAADAGPSERSTPERKAGIGSRGDAAA